MKPNIAASLLVAIACLPSAHALADGYMDCEPKGASDSMARAATKAPKKISIEIKDRVRLYANDRFVWNAELSEMPRHVYIFKKTITPAMGKPVSLTYSFDFRACDGEQTGSATFTAKELSPVDLRRGGPRARPVSTVYSCKCAVD